MKKILVAGLATTLSSAAFAGADLYGFVKASYLSNTDMANDYKAFFAKEDRNSNSDYDGESHSSFTTKQSRFGIKFDNGSKTSGKIEFDFDGESGDTAGTTNSDTGNLRTRLLEITHKVNENGTLNFGKRWDTFAALNPHTYSLTMVQLHQGNTGFLVESLEYNHKFNNIKAYFQTQMLGTNDGTSAQASVISKPINTIKVDYTMNNHLVGFAHKMGSLMTKDANGTSDDIDLSGTKLFYKGQFGATGLIAEYYMGKNLGAATTGASLGNISASTTTGPAAGGDDIEETGYYVSVKHQLDKVGIFAGYGNVQITNDEDVLTSGNKATNTATRFGVDYAADKDLTVFAELTQVTTGYWDGDSSEDESGQMLDIGLLLKF